METAIVTIGIAINIIAYIWMIVSIKSVRYIRKEDVYACYEIDQPMSITENTTWGKAWHRPKLPIWMWLLFATFISAPFLATITCFVASSFIKDNYDNEYYYSEKTNLLLGMESIVKKIKKPFDWLYDLLNKEV